jgi:predicted DNA-binding protein
MTATVAGVPNQPKTRQTNFRIPEDVKTRAQAKAESEGRTLTDVVVEALEDYAPETE